MPNISSYNALGTTIETSEVTDGSITLAKIDPSVMPLTAYTGTYSSTDDDTKLSYVAGSGPRQGGYIQSLTTSGVTCNLNFEFNLPAGDFTIIVEYGKQIGGGNFDIELDTTKQGATVDTYNGSTTWNNTVERNITVSTAGTKTINVKNLGTKNASANNYINMIQEVRVVRND